MIQMNQTYRGQHKQQQLFGDQMQPISDTRIWVVDDDIDIHDYASMDWALPIE